MTELMKLKQDRDTCYVHACAAYGKSFIDAQLHEPDEDTIENRTNIMSVRLHLTPLLGDVYELGTMFTDTEEYLEHKD